MPVRHVAKQQQQPASMLPPRAALVTRRNQESLVDPNTRQHCCSLLSGMPPLLRDNDKVALKSADPWLKCCHMHSVPYRFSWGLGMNLVAKSDQSTGNSAFASYAVQSGELVFAVTAPYSRACRAANVRWLDWRANSGSCPRP